MNFIRLERILEMISADVWIAEHEIEEEKKKRNVRSPRRTPSFSERSGVVDNMLQTASFDGKIIRFDGNGIAPVDIPAYNYLIVRGERKLIFVEGGAVKTEAVVWEIHGFDMFAGLSAYVNEAGCMCDFDVYVKLGYRYEKAFCRYAFQRPGENKTYIDEWGFHYPTDGMNGEWGRDLTYRYFFEIVGLCEFHTEREVFCDLVNSLDEVMRVLECQALSISAEQWVEHGTVQYEGVEYPYFIAVNEGGSSWCLCNAAGEEYCTYLHGFPSFSCEEITDCTVCPAIIPNI